jgi:hypothetical protein
MSLLLLTRIALILAPSSNSKYNGYRCIFFAYFLIQVEDGLVKASIEGSVDLNIDETGLAKQSTLETVLNVVQSDYIVDQDIQETVDKIYDATPKIYSKKIYGGSYIAPSNAPSTSTPGLR